MKWFFPLFGLFILFTSSAFVQVSENEKIQDLYILSDIDQGMIDIRLLLEPSSIQEFKNCTADLSIQYPDGSIKELPDKKFSLSDPGSYSSLKVNIDPVLPWHPKTPNLYTLNLSFRTSSGKTIASVSHKFGMRKLESRNARFYVNNQPFYVRACGHEVEPFLDTLDREGIQKRLTQIKRYGFNTIRHHSHIPSEEYLQVADEVGVFIQMEIHGKIGNDPASERFAESKEVWKDMIEQGRKHPCTFIYSIGNEIYKNEPGLIQSQDILYSMAKEMDPGVLVLNRSGSNPFNDPFGKYDLIERPIGEYEHIAEYAREAFWLYLRGDRKGRSEEVPIIAHEYPLVASYPNPELAYQYEEVPEYLKLPVENARKYGLEHLLPLYVKNSEAIQTQCRKEMLEEARKFPELDGYSMLRFTDCEARVSGVCTDFADPKNVSAEEFLRTNGETVLLCTWNQRRLFLGDTFQATLEISHHGPEPYSATECTWYLMDGPQVLTQGVIKPVQVGPVDVAEVGEVSIPIPFLSKASKLTFRAVLPGTVPLINNEWPIWVFPEEKLSRKEQRSIILWDPGKRMKKFSDFYQGFKYIDDPDWKIRYTRSLVITDRWQESFYPFLEKGGKLLILSDKSWPWPEEVGIFGLHITMMNPTEQAPALFPELDEPLSKWLTICSNSKSRYGNSGTIIYPHPLMNEFPHEGFCDMQFWPMIYRAKSLRLEDFPDGTTPIIRTIDNFYRGRSKGYMVEMGVGKGKVFVSTLNLTQSFDWSVSTRYFFNTLLRYLTGPDWNPRVKISAEELRAMLEKYAQEITSEEPKILNEMKARYSTRWKWLMSPTELVILPIYEAEGVDKNRLDVHYEYAQTQWFLGAWPGDQLQWEFENNSEADFVCTLNLAGILKGVPITIQVDQQSPISVEFQGSGSWSQFNGVEVPIGQLSPGSHQLVLSIPEGAPTDAGCCLNIRDVELRGKE